MNDAIKTTTAPVAQNSQDADVNYRRLISAIIDAGFGINALTPQGITEQAMTYNFMPIDVESPDSAERQTLFTVVYQPVDNFFYFSSKKDLSILFGEKRVVDHRLAVLKDQFRIFTNLMYPSLSQ